MSKNKFRYNTKLSYKSYLKTWGMYTLPSQERTS